MPQAIVNPEELRRFAGNLKQFDAELQSSMARLQAQYHRLGDTWRDQEHARFAQEFEQTMRVLQRFIQVAEQHIPFLLRKAEAAEEYLRRR
ncbi:MAG: WXG100 family type VII secretion target [Anaerolineae bacterium]|nr:WXG100 family type VII secretion target [Anaerolineae bacterium]